MQRADHFPSFVASIIEQMADAVIYVDSNGIVVLWNPAAAMLFGFAAAEAIGQSLDLIIPEHLQSAHWHAFRRAMLTGDLTLRGRPTLTRAKHQSGRKLYVEMTFAVVKGESGVVHGAVAVARDVTERVEQQRAAARGQSTGDG